jgi:hypothetical protein
MSVQTGRMVSADEARKIMPEALAGYEVNESMAVALVVMAPDLAHTVVVQAEQIAAVRALCERADRSAGLNFAVSTAAIRTALGVSGE